MHCDQTTRCANVPLSLRSRVLLLIFLLVGLLAATGFGPVGYVESREAKYPVLQRHVAEIRDAVPPSIGASAALVMEGRTGTIVYERNARERLPMASMTKMMTALLAIESGKLSQEFTIQVNAADYPDSSLMGLVPGERLTLAALLYGLMLPSGNDAAIAVARIVGGSEAGFVAMMNRRARELGLKDTHFMNPHGLDHPEHYSTAHDVAQLARYAMRNPIFARVVGTRDHVVRGKLTYDLRNTNRLLHLRDDVQGIKTGFTDAAGRCLTAFATQGDRQVITVVMNSPDYVGESATLIDYFFEHYTSLPLRAVPSPLWTPLDGRLANPATILLPVWKAEMVRAELHGEENLALVYALSDAELGRVPLNSN